MISAFGRLAAWVALWPLRLAVKHPRLLLFLVVLLYVWQLGRGRR